MSGEIALGTALLLGGTPARVGWLGVLAFHLLLMLFWLGFWLWSVPAMAVLVWPSVTTGGAPAPRRIRHRREGRRTSGHPRAGRRP
jgi:fatty acid desaturase